jgi:RNA polymerase sigma factor (sigma-70 family)
MAAHPLSPVLRHIRRACDPTPVADHTDADLLTRFIDCSDEAAFAILVHRHGPLILGVCRRLLGDVHSADDAFQATFLLLARKAGRLRRPERLGPWLYGVARRVALRARATRGRRREVPVVDMPAATPMDVDDLRPILDDAIARLPARDRTPVVLCYFQGLTYAEAARHLGCPAGTVSARLARARARLRVLLTRRGVAPTAGAVAMSLAPETLSATVPVTLRRATVALATGTAVPATIVALAKGVGHVMLLDKLKGLAVVAILGTVGAGAWVYEPAAAQPPVQAAPMAPQAAAPEPEDGPSLFRTANFVVRAPSARVARLVGEAAERERKAQATRWLGAEMPAWSRSCSLTVKITLGGSGGATKFNFDFKGGYEVLSMDLEGDLERMLASTLPHEVTHTVLADHFRSPVPRWADEGASMLAEDETELRKHDKMMRTYLNRHQPLPLRRLFDLKDYGELTDVMVVYAQGYSVTRFLVERKDRATFLRFIKIGMAEGWNKAARECYELNGVEALEAAWLADLKATQSAQAETPASPAAALDARADEAYAAKDYEKAISLWRELQQRYPDSPDAFSANLRLGQAYWGVARRAGEQLTASGRHDDNELSVARRHALMNARDSYQIIELTLIARQLTGRLTVPADEEKLKQASFWGADCDYWSARYEVAGSRYGALSIRYEGKPEEMIALSQMRLCWETLKQSERANTVVAHMRERLGAIKFDTSEGAQAHHKREFWEKMLAELERPIGAKSDK